MFSFQYESYVKTINFEGDSVPKSVYYMKQTISNACGTVAMIHSVANNLDSVKLDDGILKDFLETTKDSSPEERAKQLEENMAVCEVHDHIAKEGQTAVRPYLRYSAAGLSQLFLAWLGRRQLTLARC